MTVDRDTPMLLPPSLPDWVPADHLVHFIIDAVEQLDLRTARVNERGSGDEQYPPATMLALLVYSYVTGTFASRLIVAAHVTQETNDKHQLVPAVEARPDPSPPPDDAPFLQRLAHRTATQAGRTRYKQRQQTVEPVYGIVKAALGFRRFLRRGLAKASLEWSLVCSAYNLKRLHSLKTVIQPA